MLTRLRHEELDGRHRRVAEDDEVRQCGPDVEDELAPAHEDLSNTSQCSLGKGPVAMGLQDLGVPY
jgi:hypothetical protein